MINKKIKPINEKTTDWKYLIKEVVLFLVMSYLFLAASTHNGLVNINLLLISAILFSILLFFVVFYKLNNMSDIETPLLIYLGLFVLSSALSIDPTRSFTEFWLILIECFLLLITINLIKNGWEPELIIKVVLIIGAIFMLFGWFEAGSWYYSWLNSNPGIWIPKVSYRLPVPNFLVVMFNVMVCLAISRLLHTKEIFTKIILSVYSFSTLFLIYLTSSRGGWLGTISGLFLVIVLYQKNPVKIIKKIIFWGKKNIILSIAALLVIFFGIAIFIFVFINLSDQPTHAPLLSSRTDFWMPAIRSFINNPIFGQGPYTFFSSYLQYNSVPPSNLYVYAHNIYLDVLSGMGILGLLAFILLLVYIWRSLVQTYNKYQGQNRGVVIGVAGAFTAFCIHGFVDSVHHTIPTSAWVMAVVLGAALGLHQDKKRKSFSLVLIGVLVVISTWTNYWIMKPLDEGINSANNNNWVKAEEKIELAIKRSPKGAIAYQQLGLVQSELSYQGKREKLEEAITAYEKAVTIDPYWALNHANLAALYRENGDLDKAKNEFLEATALAPGCALYWLNLAEVVEQMGDTDSAKIYYEKFIELKPHLIESKYWQETELKKEFYNIVISNVQLNGEKTINNLEAALSDYPDSARLYIELIAAYMKNLDIENVSEVINKAKLTFFSNEEQRLDLLWYEAEMNYFKGNTVIAVNLGGEVIDSYITQGIYGPGTYGKLMYSELIFRRPSIQKELSPFLSKLPAEDKWVLREKRLLDWKE